jgi:rod shape-determining protein MreC
MKLNIQRLALVFTFTFIVVFLLLEQANSPINKYIKLKVTDFFSPLMETSSSMISFFSDSTFTLKSIMVSYKENKLLREENELLKSYYRLSLLIREENKQLRKLLNFIAESNLSYTTTRVIGDTTGPYVRSAIISVGSKDNILPKQAVINHYGLVGRIIDVGEKTSRILLLTDINSKIPVLTAESRERAIAAGDNSGLLTALYLPDDSRAKVGELIISSGDANVFPAGIPVGTIEKIEGTKVYIRPFVEWNRLDFVSVINY